jgi:hypothetical protein
MSASFPKTSRKVARACVGSEEHTAVASGGTPSRLARIPVKATTERAVQSSVEPCAPVPGLAPKKRK